MPPTPPPRRATPRNPQLRTLGPHAAQVLTAVGRRPLPWQRAGLDVALELDAAGHLAHPVVVWLVPRRAGKSVGIMGAGLHRSLTTRHAHCWYTAQTGAAASDWFRDELLPPLTDSPLFAGRWRPRLSQGHEEVAWLHTGGFFRMFAPQPDSLHGGSTHLVGLDEAWAHDAIRGAELLQAIGPTQATVPGAQLWIVSAAGDANSAFLIDQVAAARRALTAGDHGPVLLEYGVPDDLDATDVDTVARFHPAVGHTIDPRFLIGQRQLLGPDGFARAYGCYQPMAGGGAGRIAGARWTAAGVVDPTPAGAQYVIAFDVTPDRDAAVVAAWRRPDGRIDVEVLRAEHGTGWLLDVLPELARRRPRPQLAVDDSGPARDVADALARRGLTSERLSAGTYAAACAWFAEQVNTGRITHHRQHELDDAIPAATTRPLAEGWAWHRRESASPIATLVAATVAAHTLDRRQLVKPALYAR